MEDYYQDGSEWHNAFTMPAQGNWRVVAKAHYPTAQLEEYQQLTMSVWQDEDNYIRICCQEDRLYIEPGQEIDGKMVLDAFENANAVANDDGTVTIYFSINKNDNEYTVSYSQNGVDFKTLGSVTADYIDPKIVLTGGQNTDNTPVWLNFEYIAVVSRDGVDANTGYLAWACQNVADYVAADIPATTSNAISFSELPYGYTLSVESSDPAVISADGKVTPAAETKEVQLTLNVADGQASGSATVTVTVPGSGDPGCEHTYEDVVTAPTCEEKGFTTHTCSKCGGSYVDTYVDALGHKFENGVCTVCGAKDENYKPEECPSAIFSDVPGKEHWAHKGIDYAVENGLMKGVAEGKFNPGGTLTRAELVTILYREAGSPDVEYKGTFEDVADDQWYTDAVEWAAAEGVVNGVGDGTNFAPSATITREQIATILYRYSGEPAVEGDLKAFPDANKVSSFATVAMAWAVENKIITGASVDGVTYLKPLDSATREQIASIIMRYLEGE